ncbi:MAG TPA: cytochrome c, partial [Burkholderiaceae bacterium]|nr:cytochrome c [Burkholderiaceae bacterium]
MKRIFSIFAALLLLAAMLIFGLPYLPDNDPDQVASKAVTDPVAEVTRGAYLVRAGNCMACHTARGGAEYAGGRQIATPFGNFFSPNITPDE